VSRLVSLSEAQTVDIFGLPKRGGIPHLGLTPYDEELRFEKPKKFGQTPDELGESLY
jgi:hypothetical protein